MAPKETQPAQQKTCKWWVEPGHGYITDFPHACTRKAGHGPDGNYCRQHARMCGSEPPNKS